MKAKLSTFWANDILFIDSDDDKLIPNGFVLGDINDEQETIDVLWKHEISLVKEMKKTFIKEMKTNKNKKAFFVTNDNSLTWHVFLLGKHDAPNDEFHLWRYGKTNGVLYTHFICIPDPQGKVFVSL